MNQLHYLDDHQKCQLCWQHFFQIRVISMILAYLDLDNKTVRPEDLSVYAYQLQIDNKTGRLIAQGWMRPWSFN